MKSFNLYVKNAANKTIQFAAEELKKYLELLNKNISANILTFSCEENDGIIVGLWDNDTTDDDTTIVEIKGLSGKLLGSNPRSVLFAVYQYLEAIGVRWVRHGEDGEYLPENHDFSKDEVCFQKTAEHFHRAMMIEGALKLENLLENIDWCAKVGFNEYYIQFERPTYFLRRWYEHDFNPLLEKKFLTLEEEIEYNDRITDEIKKRGMELYVVGHGWHTGPFNFPVNSNDLTKEQRDVLALMNGKRDYNRGIGITQLCYSQKYVHDKISDFVIQYLEKNPNADILLFPLADGVNNHCECDECSKYRPADLYVMLLNAVDAALTERGYKQKIAIAIYTDFMWAPSQLKLNNPDRFLYCYAPYHRTYLYSYKNMGPLTDPLPEYVRNNNVMPEQPEDLLAFLKAWQEHQKVSSFAHEYYYYAGEHYFDFGSIFLANIIHEDIRMLKSFDMEGMMSCQSQRAFMPTGLGSWVMAKALWDDTVDFEVMKKEYFESAFGPEAETFSKYLTYLSDIAHDNVDIPYDKVMDAAKQMLKYISTLDLDSMHECFAASIRYIKFHCGLLIKQCEADKFTKQVGVIEAKPKWEELLNYVRLHEEEVQPVFDLHQYFTHLRQRMYPEIQQWFNNDYNVNGTRLELLME